jgi:hypothetical protein
MNQADVPKPFAAPMPNLFDGEDLIIAGFDRLSVNPQKETHAVGLAIVLSSLQRMAL